MRFPFGKKRPRPSQADIAAKAKRIGDSEHPDEGDLDDEEVTGVLDYALEELRTTHQASNAKVRRALHGEPEPS